MSRRAAGRVLVYGATGYTGRMLAEALRDRGLDPVLCARDEPALAELGRRLGLAFRVATLEGLDAALEGVRVVLNAAGPFVTTAGPVLSAALGAGAHYLDISGEIDALELLAGEHTSARRRGLMIMPGTGFDVVASDCLLASVAERLPGARRLRLGISGLGLVSRGSARTIAGTFAQIARVRRNARIEAVPPGVLARDFDFGAGPTRCLAVGWGDVSSAFYTTGVGNVEVYFAATPALEAALFAARSLAPVWSSPLGRAWLDFHAELVPPGPSSGARAQRRAVLVAEAERDDGEIARARLTTPEAYSFTAESAPAICERVLDGDFEPGFQTPARVFGVNFAAQLSRVTREELS